MGTGERPTGWIRHPEGCVRALRSVPDGLPLGDRATFLEIVALVSRCAREMGFDDLVKASEALRAGPDDRTVATTLLLHRAGCPLAGVSRWLWQSCMPAAASIRMELARRWGQARTPRR
jgi:hypothetical protein